MAKICFEDIFKNKNKKRNNGANYFLKYLCENKKR